MAGTISDLLPESAKSQGARDQLNAKTSALPSLNETAQNAGDVISGDSDVVGEVKKVLMTPSSADKHGFKGNPQVQGQPLGLCYAHYLAN